MNNLEQLLKKERYEELGSIIYDTLEEKGIDFSKLEEKFNKEHELMIAFPSEKQIREHAEKVLNNEKVFYSWIIKNYNLK